MTPGARIDAASSGLSRACALLAVMLIKRKAAKADLDEAIAKTEEALGHLRSVKEGKNDG